VRRGGRQHLGGAAGPKERVDLADATLDCQRRVVGQPRLERRPDAFDQVVVGAVAGAVQHHQPGVGGPPPPDDLGVVDYDVVADHRHDRGGGVGGQELLAKRGEGGADRPAGHPVEELPGGEIDRAEDGPPPILARRHHLLALPGSDPGGAHPWQQVDVGLVFGQHHRAGGQPSDGLAQVGEHLVAIGVTLGDQARPPPGGDLAHAAM